jgi:UDP-glucose 4-epimerase
MRILVTGGAGFIGSHIVDALIHEGHAVWVIDNLSRGKRERVHPQAQFVRMELRSPDLPTLFGDGRFDCVIHLAAQIDVRHSVADPVYDAQVNVLGTLYLLEAMRALGVPSIIFASTGGAIYGAQRQFPATEQHSTIPLSPYGVAKLTVEHYLEYYRQVHGLQYVVLRYANVYGPRQDPEGEAGVVAIFSQRILRQQRLVIYGDGDQTRDYVYVSDVARANVLALQYLANGHSTLNNSITQQLNNSHPLNNSKTQKLNNVFNIGTGIETSVTALAALMLQAADADCPITRQPARLGEQLRSVIDPTLAQEILGWGPAVPLADGLLETLTWFRAKEALNTQRTFAEAAHEGGR